MNGKYVGPKAIQLRTPSPRLIKRYAKPSRINEQKMLPIIGIDPGGTTGWSVLVLPKDLKDKDIFSWPFDVMLQNKISWTHGEIDCFDEDLACYQLEKLFDEWPTAAVVVEDFILRAGRNEKNRALLSPARITAVIKHHLWRTDRKMNLQQPSLAKTTATDDRLKLWGCYTSVGGLGHARDADRHVLTFLRRCYGPSGYPLKMTSWPCIYNTFAERDRLKAARGEGN